MLMASVPRLYEKIYARVLDSVRSSSPLRQRIFAWGRRVGERWAELAIEKRPVPAGLQAAEAPGRSPGLRQAAQAHRRADPVLHLGRRAALARHRALLLRRGAADPRGVRTHRDLAGDGGEHVPAPPPRHRRQGHPGRRDPDRPGRRDRDPRTQRDVRLLQQARGDGGGDRRGGLVPHRRHRNARRGRLSEHHRPQEGSDRDGGRQEHRAAADREPRQVQQVRRHRRDDRRPAALPRSCSSCPTPRR